MDNKLRKSLGISNTMLMYVGNLETYQGIDLLLESFALALQENAQADLVIIGGAAKDIAKYKRQAQNLNISARVHFLGPKPVKHLAMYLAQADILVSPRITGKNTPMKLYSYLDSGKALLATDLPTHTQVLNSHIAMLAQPNPEAFSQGMLKVLTDQELRSKLGSAGKQLIQQKHTYQVFCQQLNKIYDGLQGELVQRAA